MSWAKAGMKVVCIDASPNGRHTVLPVEGKVYTICKVSWWDWRNGNSGLGVWLTEIRRPIAYGFEQPWGIRRFRPIVTKTQFEDVQMFKRIAAVAPSLEDAE